MELKILKPKKALNKAFLKVKPNRTDIEDFKANLIQLIDRSNETESEEFHKNLVTDFLKKTYYDPKHFINTKGRSDLVIHNGDKAKSPVGVIIEAKKPTNKSEMLSGERINVKAFHELILYYLRERISHKNLEVKQLIATNIYEWFIFDANIFEKAFAQNKALVKQFTDFEEGRLAGKTTDFFYREIAEPFVAAMKHEVEFTYFDIRQYEKPLRNNEKRDDIKLISLFKLLTPEHLLKLPFSNDSNSLDKRFYDELLHIIGLAETKQGGKKLIERKKEGERNTGALLENTIIQLDSLDKISRLDRPSQYGENQQERLFNLGLELCITWVNRILFLKLLEAQLLSYHKGDKSYEFLSLKKIGNYDDLNSLFFQVLARTQSERNEDVKAPFAKVPYLNSSLFEPTPIEHSTLFISNLRDDKSIPIFSSTVLKDQKGKRRKGELSTLEYLFEFLNAYDFSSEGSEDIQEDNKSLINASVLGLIFEKINGYKDGSFFTPGFITMYMCRETIRRAVLQKFREIKGWNCQNLDELYDKIEDRQEANDTINSLKICDPAVGSGHFLVSALNEIIAIKNDLKILQDRQGKRLKEYQVEVVNDELIVTDEDGELFEYNPGSHESQRVQETLFHEKQTLIENCLFGVDINPNSVKICRLRLWIELLKNAYYVQPHNPSRATHSPPSKGGVPSEAGGGGSASAQHASDKLSTTAQPGGGGSISNLPYLKTFRKSLRNKLTPAEARLWTMLKGRALDGKKFRRQHSVGNYILDFYCPEEHLAIELDGQGHFEARQAEYDRERDLFLLHTGIKVLRFENKWVWDNLQGLLDEVRKEFGWSKVKDPPGSAGGRTTPPWEGGVLNRRGADGDVTYQPQVGGGMQDPDHDSVGNRAQDHPGSAGENGFVGSSTQDHPDSAVGGITPPRRGGEPHELETLPNIDINIKCGNSLISRFGLDADLKKALNKKKYNIDSYRSAIHMYQHADSKEQKREMERWINEIKSDFRSEIQANDPKLKRLYKVEGEITKMLTQQQMFEMGRKEKTAFDKKMKKLSADAEKLRVEIEEIKNNKIYQNAFEWRFEFPEVLDDNGDFTGFDVVIGNPPYIRQEELKDIKAYLQAHYQTYAGTADLYVYFVERGLSIMRQNAQFIYILPNKWMRAGYGDKLRSYLRQQNIESIVDFGDLPVFEEATTYPCIMRIEKAASNHRFESATVESLDFDQSLEAYLHERLYEVDSRLLQASGWTLTDVQTQQLLEKLRSKGTPLGEYVDGKIYRGVLTGLNEAFVIDSETREKLIAEDPNSTEVINPFLAGRDIKRYKQPESDKFLIFTRRGIEIERYPAILKYLEQYKERLIPKPKDYKGRSWPGRKSGAYKWYEMQDSVAYFEEFEKTKIVLAEIASRNQFAIDHTDGYFDTTAFIIPVSSLNLLAVLNSRLILFFFSKISSEIRGGYFRWKRQYLQQLPIVEPSADTAEALANLVRKRMEEPANSELEAEIDRLVYELYGLTEEERGIVEEW